MIRSAKIAVLTLLTGAMVWCSCNRDSDAGNLATSSPAPSLNASPIAELEAAPRRPKPGPAVPYHGMAFQIHHVHECVPKAKRLIREIADLGADTVMISNPAYQENAGSSRLEIKEDVTPSGEEWHTIISYAHDNGLRVIMMPIVLLSSPRGTEWRGVISPPSWDEWFDQYRDILLHFARIAEDNDVEVLMVGSELVSTEKFTDRWYEVIRAVREVYKGKLSYSANWDHYKVVSFWDKLDLIGMTSYYMLSSERNPSEQTLLDAWAPIKRGILHWQSRIGKPLLFTEVGWCSQEGASIYPWDYHQNKKASAAGHEEQKNCYRAFMETWRDTAEVGGVIWWEWNDSEGGPADYNYTPRGKPAEIELRKWFIEARERHQ